MNPVLALFAALELAASLVAAVLKQEPPLLMLKGELGRK
jgi:hypothetical protein